MRILVDMQGAQTPFSSHRGVGRYTVDLVKELIKNAGEHDVFLALNGAFPESINGIKETFCSILPESHIVVWQQFYDFSGQQVDTHAKMRVAELLREAFLNYYSPDVIFSTNLQEGYFDPAPTSVKRYYSNDVIYVTTLHDVIPLCEPNKYLCDPVTKKWYMEKINGAEISDAVVTVSEYSKDQILSLTNASQEKVVSIYNAVDKDKFKPLDMNDDSMAEFLNRFNITKPYILYSGGADSHKNLDGLYKSFSCLPQQIKNSYHLVLVGKELGREESMHREKLKSLGISDSVIFTGFVSDDDLVKFYNLCYLFVFPSYREGFGLPVLEAMCCGAAVLSSNSSSIREINNLTEASFDPHDIMDISSKIKAAIEDQSFYERIKRFSIERSMAFSWKESACQLLNLMESLVNKSQKKISHMDSIGVDEYIDAIINKIKFIPKIEKVSKNDIALISESLAETYPSSSIRKPRVYLDVSAVVINGDRTGIQRVVRAVCYELLKNGPAKVDIVPIYKEPSERFFHFAKDISNEILGANNLGDVFHTIDFFAGDVLLFLDLHPSLAISHERKSEYLINKGVKVYHVVYDLLPLNFPNYFWPELCEEFERWFNVVLKSSGVICISKSVSDQVLNFIKNKGIKTRFNFLVSWFHLGANLDSSLPTKGISSSELKILNDLKLSPTFLMVGTIEPRKKQEQVLMAFDNLWRAGVDVNLVFVGKNGWGTDNLVKNIQSHCEFGQHLYWLKGISDEYLEKIYEVSSCLVLASEDEGFGLPLIEAAQKKIPIIARDIPVFREVAGEHAYYFSGNHADDLAKSITDWIGLYHKNEHPKSDDMPWLTWQQSAKELLNAIGINGIN